MGLGPVTMEGERHRLSSGLLSLLYCYCGSSKSFLFDNVVETGLTYLVCRVLFYPTAIYANWAYKKEKAGGIAQADVESGEADERTGLLQGE